MVDNSTLEGTYKQPFDHHQLCRRTKSLNSRKKSIKTKPLALLNNSLASNRNNK